MRDFAEKLLAKKNKLYLPSSATLIVSVADLQFPSEKEKELISLNIDNYGFSLYETTTIVTARILRNFVSHFGMIDVDDHLCAEEGVSKIEVSEEGVRTKYIPYTNRPIGWHTDGYYNEPSQRIRSILLHCAEQADVGGSNEILDPEILWAQLTLENPDWVEALSDLEVMTVPANVEESGVIRKEISGPVFMREGDHIDIRYTDRTRSILWSESPMVIDALNSFRFFLQNSEYRISTRLSAGQGLIGRNVLHKRDGFEDSNNKRLLYRIRSFNFPC